MIMVIIVICNLGISSTDRQTERMAMVKGGAVAAIPGLGGGVDGNFTDNR